MSKSNMSRFLNIGTYLIKIVENLGAKNVGTQIQGWRQAGQNFEMHFQLGVGILVPTNCDFVIATTSKFVFVSTLVKYN